MSIELSVALIGLATAIIGLLAALTPYLGNLYTFVQLNVNLDYFSTGTDNSEHIAGRVYLDGCEMRHKIADRLQSLAQCCLEGYYLFSVVRSPV